MFGRGVYYVFREDEEVVCIRDVFGGGFVGLVGGLDFEGGGGVVIYLVFIIRLVVSVSRE